MELPEHTRMIKPIKKHTLIGWREWVGLPELGIDVIKAKVDTGARTSALHAFSVQPFMDNGKHRVAFDIHPYQRDTKTVISSMADVVDRRIVTDSGGHEEERWVIETPIIIAGQTWRIEITLTERENMLFRMLLGRSALHKRFIVNPARSFVTG